MTKHRLRRRLPWHLDMESVRNLGNFTDLLWVELTFVIPKITKNQTGKAYRICKELIEKYFYIQRTLYVATSGSSKATLSSLT
jgi:hypothetical protein